MPKIPAYQKQPLYVKAFKSALQTDRHTDRDATEHITTPHSKLKIGQSSTISSEVPSVSTIMAIVCYRHNVGAASNA